MKHEYFASRNNSGRMLNKHLESMISQGWEPIQLVCTESRYDNSRVIEYYTVLFRREVHAYVPHPSEL